MARASGIDVDARRDHPFIDLGPSFTVACEQDGDVLSRFLVRVREVATSAAVIHDLAARVDGITRGEPSEPTTVRGAGLGLVEGWRGTIAHRVELDDDGRLDRVKVVDPSFFNWPALPSPSPTRSSPTSPWPTRASTSPTPATTCSAAGHPPDKLTSMISQIFTDHH